MNYRFENTYTQAESVKWSIQAGSMLNNGQESNAAALLVFPIQFILWVPIFYFLYINAVPFHLTAPISFFSFVAIGIIYDLVIMPHVVSKFSKPAREEGNTKFEAIIHVDNDGVRTIDDSQEIIFKWAAIRDIEDTETTVFLLTKAGYCAIPARCFEGFLEKDAFVRACVEKITGKTEQGDVFT